MSAMTPLFQDSVLPRNDFGTKLSQSSAGANTSAIVDIQRTSSRASHEVPESFLMRAELELTFFKHSR